MTIEQADLMNRQLNEIINLLDMVLRLGIYISVAAALIIVANFVYRLVANTFFGGL